VVEPQTNLRWVQPKWSQRRYELRAGERVIAQLEYRGTWRPIPYIVFDSEELTVRTTGFWKSKTAIMHGDREIAQVQRTGSKAVVSFMSGRSFTWRRKGFWSTSYLFVAPDNEEILIFKYLPRLRRLEGSVQVSPSGAKYPEVRILTVLGWYLMLAGAHTAA
jgi:hypothetical protein